MLITAYRIPTSTPQGISKFGQSSDSFPFVNWWHKFSANSVRLWRIGWNELKLNDLHRICMYIKFEPLIFFIPLRYRSQLLRGGPSKRRRIKFEHQLSTLERNRHQRWGCVIFGCCRSWCAQRTCPTSLLSGTINIPDLRIRKTRLGIRWLVLITALPK